MRRFYSNKDGGTLILVGVMLPLLVITMALVVDTARIYAVQAKAQSASDVALLGAVSTRSTTDLETEALRLFRANYPDGYMGSSVTLDAISELSECIYSAKFEVTVPASVTGVFADDITTIYIESEVRGGFGCTPQVGLELALALDNTGSMEGSKIDALKSASSDLVNILFGDSDTLNNLHISIVPYDLVVNIGVGREGWIQADSVEKYNSIIGQWGKGGAFNRFTDHLCGPYPREPQCRLDNPARPSCCVDLMCDPTQSCHDGYTRCASGQTCSAETGECTPCTPTDIPPQCTSPGSTGACTPNGLVDASDQPPSAGTEWLFRLPYELRLSENGNNNANKWVRYMQPITFASNVKAELLQSLSVMEVSGNTRINVGLMWAWFTLSPKWVGLWDPGKPGLPAEAGPTLDKALVLMTDGQNIYSGDNNRTSTMCSAVKSQGITLYTIGFGDDVDEALLRACATSPAHYFFAPDEEDLRTVFREIADDLQYNTLHLSK
ncbi:MAG: VWA domain-containing protein [Rickettsiales bacterium]